MKIAAVAQLKARISRYLSAVKAGEELIVTERGRPIAKIVPVAEAIGGEQERLRRLELQGLVRIGSGKWPRRFWKEPRPKDPKGLVRQGLLDERSEADR